ncbi:MAG TPA: CysB family HTH-type transcriptional regulator [Candidatus Competibacteraceae bacterium]|nr:MAG: CysB family HTH-type transcriptional regulator [Candidatus Competibacteraceae bacterium]HOB60907.1 CysB family HTH-type transcriptional regulator [Candidatus Competibacteraceae bacterium]HQA26886.1 CysB family HTH-type transcriptional regulator [Candidatus Competibacteraceae bacterium]HQD55079.1 CysB family HTH-type transcriptional regulator [Candidatus Competibacteraceae bacterium]
MNFQQLRIIQEAVRCHFNLTEVANALFTSQSGVSKHIKDLEDELGIELFVRRGKRLLGLTEPGQELVMIVRRILLDARNIRQLAEQFSNSDHGKLRVATTHTQARYALPPVVEQFRVAFPKVQLALHQVNPAEIAAMLLAGETDIGIATEALATTDELAAFAFYQWHHAVTVPVGHPLATLQPLTLDAIAEYPLITYHEGFTGRAKLDAVFARAGLMPDIAISALDADVIKTYVELGLGVGIIASVAFDPAKDVGLRLLDSNRLFESNITWIAVRRGHYLRNFAYRFIELCNAELNETLVRNTSAAAGSPPFVPGSIEMFEGGAGI